MIFEYEMVPLLKYTEVNPNKVAFQPNFYLSFHNIPPNGKTNNFSIRLVKIWYIHTWLGPEPGLGQGPGPGKFFLNKNPRNIFRT